MKMVPSSSTLVELKIAFEFIRGSSLNSLPGAPTIGVLSASPPRDTLRWLIIGRESSRSETRSCKKHKI